MQQKITQVLGWTDMEHSQYIYDCGLAYLHVIITGDDQAIAAMERSRIFWNWWKNHWQQRDAEFLLTADMAAPSQRLRMSYRMLHNARKLASKIYPNSVVLHDSYAVMIDDFINSVLYE